MAGRNAKADGEQASPVQEAQEVREAAPETVVEATKQEPEVVRNPQETGQPAGHNGNNRRISAILRENRRTDPGAMLAANRRLRGECARLRAEVSGRSK